MGKGTIQEIVRDALTAEFFIAAMKEGHGPAEGQPVGEWVAKTATQAFVAVEKIFKPSDAAIENSSENKKMHTGQVTITVPSL